MKQILVYIISCEISVGHACCSVEETEFHLSKVVLK